MKKYLIIGGLIIVLGLVIWKQGLILPQKNTQTTVTPTIKPLTTSPVPAGWQRIVNNNLAISVDIPKSYSVEKSGEYSIIVNPPKTTPNGEGDENANRTNPQFFYVSVVPTALKGNNQGIIYNYDGITINKLLATPVGSKVSLSTASGQDQWFTFERQPNQIINGKTAKVYINQEPWEFPKGTQEYRYVFDLPEKTVIAGGYIESDATKGTFDLSALTQIVKTLSLSQ